MKIVLKRPLYKNWWIWVISFSLIIISLLAVALNNDIPEKNDTNYEVSEKNNENQGISDKDIKFYISNVNNDTTGNWRISTIAENIQMQDYALEYYKKYFKNDNEIHAIVNFALNTTTKISVIGDRLDVSVHEYVKKEEHDAKKLFSGKVLAVYHVYKDSGKIEKIQ